MTILVWTLIILHGLLAVSSLVYASSEEARDGRPGAMAIGLLSLVTVVALLILWRSHV